MSRLIVVSNRVNPPNAAGEETVGGLAMALSAALREYSGLWFGWSGKTVPTFTGALDIQTQDGVTSAVVDLEEADLDEYYNGYANTTLWPLFHYRTDLAAYDRVYGEGYSRVNKRFAETLAPLIEPDDLIWVHDYHLIPLGRDLRNLGVKNRIGFFLHVPWPARQVFTTLPGHALLAQAMFDYDLVGFQTAEFCQAFEEYVLNEAGGSQPEPGRLKAFGRSLRVGAFPIGIDAPEFAQMLKSPKARRMRDLMTAATVFRNLVVGVDRLDYSKGLVNRIRAFDRLWTERPQLHRTVSLLQIATPSRGTIEAYGKLQADVARLVTDVNGRHGEADWTPIRWLNKGFSQQVLAGLYRTAQVGVVTPLHDGMNLVAKEYVAAQNPADPGVLVLSKFAGAANELDAALLVNPHDIDGMARSISTALSMPLTERQLRYEAMMVKLRGHTIQHWFAEFIDALGDCRFTRAASEPLAPTPPSLWPLRSANSNARYH